MKTLSDIFTALPPSNEIAAFVSEDSGRAITDRAVRAWKLEGRGIPGRYWPAIIRLARQEKAKWVTWELLDAVHNSEASHAA